MSAQHVSAAASSPSWSEGAGDDRGSVDPRLESLAASYGVETRYSDWRGQPVRVPRSTIVAVLAGLGVDASTPDTIEQALRARHLEAWRRTLPPVIVTAEGSTRDVAVHLPHGQPLLSWVLLEDGRQRPVPQVDRWVDPQEVDGQLVGEATVRVPGDLPRGWHRLCVRVGEGVDVSESPLVVAPARLELPPPLANQATWGVMAQLYAARSTRSWGVGDLADLADLATWSAERLGAGFIQVNPLHAAEPVGPMEPSPYLPTTRRFFNPLYLRVEDVPEVGYLPASARGRLDELATTAGHGAAQDAQDRDGKDQDGKDQDGQDQDAQDERLDRQAAWAAKREALDLLWAVPRSRTRQRAYREYVRREGAGLVDFATWCALVEQYGMDRAGWPAGLEQPTSPLVGAERARLADRVDFYCWTQWLLDEQLAAAQAAAQRAGMTLGIVHDLAVGVHPGGADAWALSDVLAHGVNVGAPPDAFNQQGQDWSQPPWRPDALAQAGYAPYRDMLRTVLRHAGGVRVDHVMGLFRLWWVPAGRPPAEGTYVRYDHEALVGVLALEADRAGAVVVGEDLGTVEPWVRDYLQERGILGTSILWFELDDNQRPRPPDQWRQACLATVTTHDLPPTAAYLTGEHVRLRHRLGLLTRPFEEESAVDTAERRAWLDALVAAGLLDEPTAQAAWGQAGPHAQQSAIPTVTAALHQFLARTPARLLGVSLSDLVGDRRVINQPGTADEYPNWQLPLADATGRPMLLDHLDEVVNPQLVDVVRAGAAGREETEPVRPVTCAW